MLKNHRAINRRWLVLFPVFLLFIMQFSPVSHAEIEFENHLESERRCGVKGEKLIDAGDYKEAVILLGKGVGKFPRSDWLIGLYGEALYLGGYLEKGERQFRKALSMNKKNPVAKKYIEEIRRTQDLLEDRGIAEWIWIGKDKGADFVLFVIGVWFGTLLTLFSQKFMVWMKKKNFDKAIRQGNYDSAIGILETLVNEARIREVKTHLTKMLSELSLEKTEKILADHAYDQEAEQKLLFVLRKMHRQQRKAS